MTALPVGGLIAGIMFAAIWAGSFIAAKFALPLAPPLWLAAGRLLAAALVLLAFWPGESLKILREASPRGRAQLFAAAILGQSCYLGATLFALVSLPAALVSILGSCLPLLSIPVARVALGEHAAPRDILATIVGVISMVVVILNRPGAHDLTAALLSPPVAAMLTGVLALALGNALLKSVVSKSNLVPLVATQMAIGGLALLPAAFILEGPPRFAGAPPALYGFAYLVLIGSIAGTWMWVMTLNRFSAIGASGFFLLVPLFGLLFGRLWLDEVATPVQLLATAVLCAMILTRSRHPISRR